MDYIPQPIEETELIARVETHLAISAMRRQLEFQNRELRHQEQHLEELVRQRTAELSAANLQLQREITERKQREEQLREHQERLRALTTELVDTEEKERRRLAKDLHDSVSQNLALCLAKLKDMNPKEPQSRPDDDFAPVISALEAAVSEVRLLTFQLSPPDLYAFGLEAGLEWLAEHFIQTYGLPVSIHSAMSGLRLPQAMELILFRITRELLTNVAKHARASWAEVLVNMSCPGEINITVTDDGMGLKTSDEDQPKAQGFGLFSIRETLQLRGGRLTIQSEHGCGCTVSFSLPLPDESNGEAP